MARNITAVYYQLCLQVLSREHVEDASATVMEVGSYNPTSVYMAVEVCAMVPSATKSFSTLLSLVYSVEQF